MTFCFKLQFLNSYLNKLRGNHNERANKSPLKIALPGLSTLLTCQCEIGRHRGSLTVRDKLGSMIIYYCCVGNTCYILTNMSKVN